MDSNDGFPWTIQQDDELGAWLYERLTATYALETETWAIERVERITARLNAVRAACPESGGCTYALNTHIVWIGMMTAFAAPGRWIYITRELLQCFPTDEPVALVLAHEMAHHDLGHIQILRPALARLRGVPGNVLLLGLLRSLERLLVNPEREAAADAYALDLCIAAGYSPRDCLKLFDILESHLLDHRDIEGVYGPDMANPKAMRLWERARGYPSLHARRNALIRQMREYIVG